MRRLTSAWLGVFLIAALGGCGAPDAATKPKLISDAPTESKTAPAAAKDPKPGNSVERMYLGPDIPYVDNVCDQHGNRLYWFNVRTDNGQGALSVATADPTCPKPTS